MRLVRRDEIMDYVTYEERRHDLRLEAMQAKAPRRIHVGPYLTFLFENTGTIRYQIQEMVRAEKLVRESDILHELSTYNELLGGPGELGATLLIEITDPAERKEKLSAWLTLPQHVHARMADGSRATAVFDARQIDDGKLSSVHYVKFPLGGQVPVALVVDLPGAEVEHVLTADQRAALAADLGTT